MAIRIVRFIAAIAAREKIEAKISEATIIDSWQLIDADEENIIFHILLSLENSQTLIDSVQSYLDDSTIKKAVISSVEATLPKEELNEANEKNGHDDVEAAPREELYTQLSNQCTLKLDFILFTLLSTVVAAVGLLEDKTIAIIAAMVIAPMFEPNVGLALGVALWDRVLIYKALLTNAVGILTCILLSILIGYCWPDPINSTPILHITKVGYSNIVLALAAGAAGVLSLTSRTSSVLVGVMVAVALLPPLVACGILVGAGMGTAAIESALLFVINIVSINLSANIVFITKNIQPYRWYQKQKAKKALMWYSIFWVISLLALCAIIYLYYDRG